MDSSVAAALLLEKGYKVIGVHMEMGPAISLRTPDVKEIAKQLGISLIQVSLASAFRQDVVNYFTEAYLKGRTPNPCIVCNEKIKLGILLRRMREMNVGLLATGHYARIRKDGERYIMLKARAASRDQSYFLHRLTQNQLSSVLFPLGDLKRNDVKTIAKNLGLKGLGPESREICFIPDSDYKRFLVENIGDHIMKAGDIVDTSGSVLGRHSGIYGFTIGQRRGIGIPSTRPYYVKGFDVKNNLVIVGRKEELLSRGLVAGDVNWIAISRLDGKLKVKTRIRYRHREAESAIECHDDRVRVIFGKPQEAIAPGQAAVFYKSDKVIGGGWIESAIEN